MFILIHLLLPPGHLDGSSSKRPSQRGRRCLSIEVGFRMQGRKQILEQDPNKGIHSNPQLTFLFCHPTGPAQKRIRGHLQVDSSAFWETTHLQTPVDTRKLEHDRAPTPSQRKRGHQAKSSYIHVSFFGVYPEAPNVVPYFSSTSEPRSRKQVIAKKELHSIRADGHCTHL